MIVITGNACCAVPISAEGNDCRWVCTTGPALTDQPFSCTLSPTLVVPGALQGEASVHTTNEWWSYLALLLRAEGLGGYTATIQDYPDDLQCTELRLLA